MVLRVQMMDRVASIPTSPAPPPPQLASAHLVQQTHLQELISKPELLLWGQLL